MARSRKPFPGEPVIDPDEGFVGAPDEDAAGGRTVHRPKSTMPVGAIKCVRCSAWRYSARDNGVTAPVSDVTCMDLSPPMAHQWPKDAARTG